MQVLTVLDVNSRWNLGQYCAYTIKKEDVISLFDSLFESYDLPKGICVSSDNGSQFIATEVQEYFRDKRPIQSNQTPFARLFEISNSSGKIVANEIFQFSQIDLNLNDVMLLDAWDQIFLWIGLSNPKYD